MLAQPITTTWGFAALPAAQWRRQGGAVTKAEREAKCRAIERGERELSGPYCRCSACGTVFSSVTDFDAHRQGKFLQISEKGRGRYCVASQ